MHSMSTALHRTGTKVFSLSIWAFSGSQQHMQIYTCIVILLASFLNIIFLLGISLCRI